jgi:hypothetical protein
MMRRLGPRLFALSGSSAALLCGRTAASEEDVYCEERCGRWVGGVSGTVMKDAGEVVVKLTLSLAAPISGTSW